MTPVDVIRKKEPIDMVGRILAGRRRSGTFEFRSLYVRLRAERARKNQTI